MAYFHGRFFSGFYENASGFGGIGEGSVTAARSLCGFPLRGAVCQAFVKHIILLVVIPSSARPFDNVCRNTKVGYVLDRPACIVVRMPYELSYVSNL